MSKKKNKVQSQQQLSPEQFIRQQARKLPVEVCYISNDIQEFGTGYILVVRRHPNNKFTVAAYLLDIFCLGVKDSFCRLRLDEFDYKDFIGEFKKMGISEISYNEAHNWIFGAIAFAEEAGLNPHSSFGLTRYMLEEDTEEIPLIEYDYGKDGEHYLIAKTQQELSRYVPVLRKNLGDNFTFVLQDDEDDDYDDYDDFDDEDYEEEEDPANSLDRDELDSLLKKLLDGAELKRYGPDTPYTYQHPVYPSTLDVNYPWLEEMFSSPENSSGLSKEQIDRVLALPIDSLRHDLEQIILYHIGQTCDGISEEMEDKEYSMPITHALFFLGEVGNDQSLDVVFEVLRQSRTFSDFHFGDAGDDVFVSVLYKLGHHQLDKMMAFAKEEGLNTFNHYNVFPAVAYIVEEEANRRDEVIEWFREILCFAAEKLPEARYFDYSMAGLIICNILDIKAVELIPEIKAVFDTGLVDLGCCGKYEEVKRELLNPLYVGFVRDYPLDIYDQYDEYRRNWG